MKPDPQADMFLRTLGLREQKIEVALGAFEPTPAIAAVDEFAADPKQRILLLSGAASCGKTIAAAHWLATLQRYGKADTSPAGWAWLRPRTEYAKAYALGQFNLRYRDEDRIAFERLKLARWLVVDDLGAETQDSIAVAEELIDARSEFGWTVITTNLPCGPKFDSSPFVQRYGARIADRIAGNGIVRGCGAANLRRPGAA